MNREKASATLAPPDPDPASASATPTKAGQARLLQRLSRPWIPGLVLAASLVLTAAAVAGLSMSFRAREHAAFENEVATTRDRIEARLDIFIALLRAAAGMMEAEEVSRQDFHRFVTRLDMPERYPGAQGVGFAARVPRSSLAAFEREVARELGREFRVWPDHPREEYYPIIYLEPPDARNAAALGYDMFTEPLRREAMERARDLGQPALTGRVELVQEIDPAGRQAGFLIYVPAYTERDPEAIPMRRSQLFGFTYSPFRADDFFNGIFSADETPRVWFTVYDGPLAQPVALLHRSSGEIEEGARPFWQPDFSDTLHISVAGREWTMVFRPTAAFGESSRLGVIPLLAAIGLAVSILIFVAIRTTQILGAQADAARAAAEEANLAKTQFLARMSHDLRTPLNAIGGYVDLIDLGIRGPVTPEQRKDLQRIKYAQNHLLGLINDVLNFAKLEAGRVQIVPQEVPVEDAVSDVESLIRPLAEEKGVSYRRGDGNPSNVIWADRDKLDQILLNLASNAIKFTDKGGEVRIAWRSHDEQIAIEVSDNGRGIPPGKLASIFEPFVQVQTDGGGRPEGSGLGLAISHELARAMGGDLTVDSTEGVGSTFTLRLPANVTDDRE